MSYVIGVTKGNATYCLRASVKDNRFLLVPVESDSDLSRIFCHPYRNGAMQILNWINDHDSELASEGLEVYAEGKFRK
jgi:hypothetical protein